MRKVWTFLFLILLIWVAARYIPARAGQIIIPEDWSAVGESGTLGKQVMVGDFNGDGYGDIVANEPNYDGDEGPDQGGVFVWMGSATGYGDPGTMGNADWYALGEYEGGDSDSFGWRTAVGDFNGDNYDDLVVSCAYCSELLLMEGAVYVYLGSASGLGPNGTKDNADWKFSPMQDVAEVGYGSLAVGNINGDNYDDLIVGVSYYDTGGNEDAGIVCFYQGSASGLGENGTPGNADWMAEGGATNDYLGSAVATGDLNGDGYADLAVSAPYDENGKVFVWEGSVIGLGENGTPANADWIAESDRLNSDFAASHGMLAWGDFNGDTYADLAVAAKGYGTSYEGAIFVWEGSASGLGPNGTPVNTDWTATGEQQLDYLGTMITTGDFGHDGYDDLVTIKDTPENGWLLSWYGSDTGLGADGTPTNADASLSTQSTWVDVADTNNDLCDDLLVGDFLYPNGVGKVYLYLVDWMPPQNPTTVTESGGTQDGIWQNAVSDPAFTWSGASDDISGVEGYFLYFGEDQTGTDTYYITETAYDPAAVSSGTSYLRISTLDQAGNQADWETIFTFQYDSILPTNPTAATELGGAQDDVLQDKVSDPSFTWSGADGTVSAVDGYYVYFGENSSGTSTDYVTEAAYNPTAVISGTYYLRARTQDEAKNQAGWVTLFTFRYEAPEEVAWTLYLPLIGYDVPPVVIPTMDESEPNNLFEEADPVNQLPVNIHGNHDGAAGTGDVYMLDDNLVTAGDVVQASIDTDDATGLQLVAYDPQGDEIARAYDGEFVVSFILPASGVYYLYVYTDPGANNTADYELLIEILP